MEFPLSYSFSIAGLVIGLRTSLPIKVTEPFLPFLTEAESDYTALFREVPALPAVSGRALFRSVSYTVYRDEQGGSDPARLGKKVARVLQRRRMPFRLRVARADQHLAVFLHDGPPCLHFAVLRSYYLGRGRKSGRDEGKFR